MAITVNINLRFRVASVALEAPAAEVVDLEALAAVVVDLEVLAVGVVDLEASAAVDLVADSEDLVRQMTNLKKEHLQPTTMLVQADKET